MTIITISRKTFQQALGHIHGVIEKKTTVPVLSHVYISAQDAAIDMMATDLEMGLKLSLEATCKEPHIYCVPAMPLCDVARKFPDADDVVITYDGDKNRVQVTCGKSHFEFPCLPGDDFPHFKVPDLPHTFHMQAQDLVKMIENTRFAMSHEETRYFLNGLYLHPQTNPSLPVGLACVSTDSHRLAYACCEMPADFPEDTPGVILSRKTVHEMHRLLSEKTDEITLSLSPTQVSMTLGSIFLVSRVIDGQYPPYQEVIPSHDGAYFKVSMASFAQSVERVAILSEERTRGVCVHLSPHHISLTSIGKQTSTADEDVSCFYEGEPLKIGLNAQYMLDIARISGDVEATFYVGTDPKDPILIHLEGYKDRFFVIMPLLV